MQKTRQNKRTKKKNADPNSPAACTYMSIAFFVFWFSSFLYFYPRCVKTCILPRFETP